MGIFIKCLFCIEIIISFLSKLLAREITGTAFLMQDHLAISRMCVNRIITALNLVGLAFFSQQDSLVIPLSCV